MDSHKHACVSLREIVLVCTAMGALVVLLLGMASVGFEQMRQGNVDKGLELLAVPAIVLVGSFWATRRAHRESERLSQESSREHAEWNGRVMQRWERERERQHEKEIELIRSGCYSRR